jgi:4-amino-4-deoxy-L-arabinose transferase-like glycosyltransferase
VRYLAAAIAAVTGIRLIVAMHVPLAPDEAYYWVWSRALAGGYLDHPPMVALWVRAGTDLLGDTPLGDTPLGVRLLGPLAAALASWLIFDAARSLYGDSRAGIAAALLLNGTLLLGVGTVIMTPDSPLLFFWTATLWAMARLIRDRDPSWWLLAGLFGGLALDSKYTALLLWVGIGAWVLLAGRAWLRRWQPWVAILIGLAIFLPVLVWNAGHHWAGFLKQGGRVGDWQPWRAASFLGELVGSQIGLLTPLIALLFAAALWAIWRERRDPGQALLLSLSLPPIVVFIQHAIGDRVQGNWPAIVYPALSIAAGGMVARRFRRLWPYGAALGYAITALAYLQASTRVLPLPLRLDPTALQLVGWDSLARQADTEARADRATFIAVEGYGPSAEIAWHLPQSLRVIGADDHWATTVLPRPDVGGATGLLLRDAREMAPPDPSLWSHAERLGTLQRLPMPGGRFAVYRVVLQAAAPKLVVLPRR